jgi:hypothetical protein
MDEIEDKNIYLCSEKLFLSLHKYSIFKQLSQNYCRFGKLRK